MGNLHAIRGADGVTGAENGAASRWRTWAIFAAALVPLVVLLGLQYLWLERLERASADAHRATLDNVLEAVASGVESHYRALGERVLNLPASVFTPDRFHKAPYYFKKKELAGVKRLFVVAYAGEKEKPGWPVFYDPGAVEPAVPLPTEERAVYMAIAPWKILAYKGGPLEKPTLSVEERDPAHRLILNPITDDSGRIVGLAGLVVDPSFFEKSVLPGVVRDTLKHFKSEAAELPLVFSHDGGGREICLNPSDSAPPPGRPESTRHLTFLFSDWELAIHGRHYTPAGWARRNFAINLALSCVLTAVVAGGVLFALRAASRAMRLSQMKSDFVSNVSHELRTPLASIRVFGELLRLGKAESPEKVRAYGEYIETESRRLTQLINNILDLARIESGRKSYELAAADLEEVVRDTLRTFRPSLEQAGFRLAWHPPASPLPPARIDGSAIGQSLANLLDNAAKYSGSARDIEVSLERAGDADDFAVVSVVDHGIGIPRDEQAKIFDRFHRVSTGLVHDVKGSGLGLAIVHHIAEAHGGRIEVESRPGEGSRFRLFVPLTPVPPDAATEPMPAGELGMGSSGGPRTRPTEA
jgi:signal transduction histidine kinase